MFSYGLSVIKFYERVVGFFAFPNEPSTVIPLLGSIFFLLSSNPFVSDMTLLFSFVRSCSGFS